MGKMPLGEAEALLDHLDACPRCQAKLQTVSDIGDTLIDCLRQPWERDEFQDEPQLQEAIARAKAIGAGPGRGGKARGLCEANPDVLGELGEYRFLEKLAEGGMGTVYKALHTRLGRDVAIKILPLDDRASERAIARFEQEIKSIGQLDHPHIVRALDAREVEGTRFLVLEYIDGSDLSWLVRRRGPLPVAEACDLVRQAAVGLQYAHRHGLIHRDVKPSNLIVDQEGQLKILDLGLALLRPTERSGDEMTCTGQPMGTPEMTRAGQPMGTAEYMAPEQASDAHSVDVRADVYGLGCTLHYLLVGRAPYTGQSAFQILTAHHQSPIPSLRAERDDVPEKLDRVFQKMLAKTPAERHASMTEVIADLEDCLAEAEGFERQAAASQARSANLRPKTVKWLLVAALVTGAVAVMVLLAGVIFKLKTPAGTLIFRVDQQDAEVGAKAAGRLAARPETGEPPPLAVAPFRLEQAKQHQQAWADYLDMPIEWENSLGMHFVLIPPGEFLMGSSPEEQARFLEEAKAVDDRWAVARIPTEGPPHPVKITRPFYLGKHEVTQTQWEGAMGHNPSSFRDPTGPVQNVSWHDARMFTERLNGVSALRGRYASTPLDVSGMTYALPTEAQWEYACRAGTTTAFCFGDSEDTLGEYAWHAANSGETTHAVGQLKPNAWALYDMHGNVWEWCADWDAADYYVQSPGIDPGGPPTGSTRIFRSGSWGHYACAARSAFRRSLSPDFRYHSFGVRVALVFDREFSNGKHTQRR